MGYFRLWSGYGSPVTTFLALSVILVLARVFLSRRTHCKPLPPGPKPDWLGRVDLPKSYQWRTYASWKPKYGKLRFNALRGDSRY